MVNKILRAMYHIQPVMAHSNMAETGISGSRFVMKLQRLQLDQLLIIMSFGSMGLAILSYILPSNRHF